MKRLFHILLCVSTSLLLAQDLARPRKVQSLVAAKRLFAKFVFLTQRQNPQLAKLYADHAEIIEDKAISKNEKKTFYYSGEQYKVILKAKLKPLRLRAKNTTLKVRYQPKIRFSSIAYTALKNDDVKIKGIYYSRITGKYNTFSMIVGETSHRHWQILYQVFYSY